MDVGPWISATPGVNRFVWNLRHDGAARVPGDKTSVEANEGPFVTPGKFIASLSVGKERCEVSFEVINDPRVKTSNEDLRAQEKLLLKMRDKVSDAHVVVNKLRDAREQIQAWKKRAGDEKKIAKECDAILKKLDKIEDELILPGEQKDDYGLISRTRLNAAIGSLISVVNSADTKPTTQCTELFDEMSREVDKQRKTLDAVFKNDVKQLNKMIEKARLPAVKV
jgi:hypothetical protein